MPSPDALLAFVSRSQAEIKHGRICQLAWAGWLFVDGGNLAPGAPHVTSLEAHDTTVKTGHMLLLLFAIAIPEALSYNAISEMMSGQSDRKPGDYGIGWRFCKVRPHRCATAAPLRRNRGATAAAPMLHRCPRTTLRTYFRMLTRASALAPRTLAGRRPEDAGEVQARRDYPLPRGDARLRRRGDAVGQAGRGGPTDGLPVRWRLRHLGRPLSYVSDDSLGRRGMSPWEWARQGRRRGGAASRPLATARRHLMNSMSGAALLLVA